MADDSNRWTRGGWRSPAGLGTIAGVVSVLVAVIALFVDRERSGDGPPPTHFFVYGTTMPGHLRYPLIQDLVAESTPASVSGRLYDSGAGYPAAKFGGGEGTIDGYLLRIRPERVAEARRVFTEIEAGLFEPVTVTTVNGVTATSYEFIGAIDGLNRLGSRWDGAER